MHIMRFGDAPSVGGIHTQQGLRSDACDFWDAHLGPRAVSDFAAPQANPGDVLV